MCRVFRVMDIDEGSVDRYEVNALCSCVGVGSVQFRRSFRCLMG